MPDSLRILYLVPYAPTPIRTRPYNLCLSLTRAGHILTLATCWESHDEQVELGTFSAAGIRVLGRPLSKVQRARNITNALFAGQPMQGHYSWQPELFRAVWEEIQLNSYDIVHLEHLRGARYGKQLRIRIDRAKLNLPLIWDSVDCISYLFEQAAQQGRTLFGRIITRLELGRTKKYEASLGREFDRILITSPADAQAFQRLDGFEPPHPIEILPNGVDLENFRPAVAPRSENTVIFTGKLSYHANVSAALHLIQEIMPLVWQQKPQMRVQLVGKDPDRALRALAEADARIQVTGTVKDLRPYLQSAALSVAPMLYGAGIQNKVLEAMACGVPVVAYPVAVSGLQGIHPGEEFLLAHDPPEFSQKILQLLDDFEHRKSLAERAYRYVSTHCSWEQVARNLAVIYQDAIERTSIRY